MPHVFASHAFAEYVVAREPITHVVLDVTSRGVVGNVASVDRAEQKDMCVKLAFLGLAQMLFRDQSPASVENASGR